MKPAVFVVAILALPACVTVPAVKADMTEPPIANDLAQGAAINTQCSSLSASVDATTWPSAPSEESPEALYQMASLNDQCGRTEASLAYLRLLVRDFPAYQHIREVRFRLAEADYAAQRYEEASRGYEGVVSDTVVDGFTGPSEYKRAFALNHLKDPVGSVQAFLGVIDLSSDAFWTSHDRSAVSTDALRAIVSLLVQHCVSGDVMEGRMVDALKAKGTVIGTLGGGLKEAIGNGRCSPQSQCKCAADRLGEAQRIANQ